MTTADLVLQTAQTVKSEVTIDYLGDTYTVVFVKDVDESIIVELHNRHLHMSKELAVLKNGFWSYITEERFQEMLTIMQQCKNVHRLFKRMIRLDIYASFNKQISCGRRRFNIAVTRMFHKLTK